MLYWLKLVRTGIYILLQVYINISPIITVF
jgi:hypothetical protein